MKKVIISGGGTGGHIFPAVAIADELKKQFADIEILFIGAEGKMEMEKVPQAGYQIIGLPIVGFQRKLTLKNLLLPFKIIKSMMMARKIIKSFQPQVVVGVGGYASGPTLKMATMLNIPTLVQEQNSFAGKTNQLLAKKVNTLCVAYEGMDKFFPKNKIVLTGNPVRFEVTQIEGKRKEAARFFNFDENKKTLLIIGGSLGARTLNESVLENIELLEQQNIQIIWQCGKIYHEELKDKLKDKQNPNLHLSAFISKMDLAYSIADVIISRAGAISVSELCLIQKPVVLVPSPNVAEDHQTHNAMALVNQHAAILVKDIDAKNQLVNQAISLLNDVETQQKMAKNIAKLGKPNATKDIVNEIIKITKQ